MPNPATQKELEAVFSNDAAFAAQRDAHYEASWKARGGPGAFFTIARPWDRFEAIAKRGHSFTGEATTDVTKPYDVFHIIGQEQQRGLTEANDGTLQACIRDLRIYMALLAVEAQRMRATYLPPRESEVQRETVTRTPPVVVSNYNPVRRSNY